MLALGRGDGLDNQLSVGVWRLLVRVYGTVGLVQTLHYCRRQGVRELL